MRLWAAVVLIAVSVPSIAAETRKYWVGKGWRDFVVLREKSLLISADCQKDGKLDCDAYKALARASLKGHDQELELGTNPGAVACQFHFKATVVMGKDAKAGQNSFCQFPDGSLVDTGTLSFYAHRNDER